MNILHKNSRPRGIFLLPNLFTIGSFFAGFFAIIASFKGSYDNAAIAIFVAMIMDSLDGRVARMTNTMTAFGAEFDSLADMVSFAIAPAVLAYTWGLSVLGKFGWLSAFVYMVTVALRLARFNTQIGNVDKRYFQGLPCPSAAAVVTSFVWICYDFAFTSNLAMVILAFVMIIVGILMVSNIRFRSFKDAELKDHVPFVVILITVLVVVLITFDPSKVLFVVFAGYAISGPVATVWGLQQKKRMRRKFFKLNQ
ncbi:MAG: CDP-diacylglycerol-serine O-phosphatidyltransferase [uncultured bacterium]|nr:MAG: CDP-diacylglycerol-serine O-phosphatidyltransferase [uncultured bacterium]